MQNEANFKSTIDISLPSSDSLSAAPLDSPKPHIWPAAENGDWESVQLYHDWEVFEADMRRTSIAHDSFAYCTEVYRRLD